MNIAFFGDSVSSLEKVYSADQRKRLAEVFDVVPEFVNSSNLDKMLPALADLDVIFSTWGMLKMDESALSKMPRLKVVFYAAGSVQGFARPFLEKGIRVTTARRANGQPVAEFALAQIILSLKGYFVNTREYREKRGKQGCAVGPGAYGETIALLGCGTIARQLLALLRPLDIKVLVFDPFLDEREARQLGVARASLEDCFERACVVSNHIPNLESTRNALKGNHFASMRKGAVFINTGRGATVENEGFVKVFKERPDLTALLDVTWPEPLPPDSPLFDMPNVHVSTHIAGSANTEVARMGDETIADFYEWLQNGALRDEVTLKMLDTMA
jgi:phosphoglycerate dehydrogenase-like enzyme